MKNARRTRASGGSRAAAKASVEALPVTLLEVGGRAKPAASPSAPSRRLDVFANPAPERDYLIQFAIPEFTCLCPLTGQPDFAHFTMTYVPDALCVELKSLKLYLWSFREQGAFHEDVTNQILDDLVASLNPRRMTVHTVWNVRGGIHTTVTASTEG